VRKLFGFVTAFALLCGVSFATRGDYRDLTTQQALNRMLNGLPNEYTTQQALNKLSADASKRDSLVTLLSWQWDDALDTLWAGAYMDTFQAHNQPFSVGVIAWQALHGDTTQDNDGVADEYLSVSKLRALRDRRITNERGVTSKLCAFLGHGWYPNTELWQAEGTAMSRGEYTSMTPYEQDVERCFLAIRDTIGLPEPRGWVSPNSAAFPRYNEIIGRFFDYQITSGQTSTGTSTTDLRWNYEMEPYYLAGFPRCSAYPGLTGNPYEIYYPLNEGLTWTELESKILDAVSLRGSWIIFVGHNPGVLATSTGKSMEFILDFVDSLVTAGTMRVVTADEGYQLSFETPVAATANWIWPNLEDNDGDGQPDYLDTNFDRFNIGNGIGNFAINGTRDSVWSGDGTRDDHGVYGNGYAAIGDGPGYVWGDVQNLTDSHASARWFKGRDITFFVPAGFHGKRVQFDFYAQVDQAVEDVSSVALSSSDSIGVTFSAWRNGYGNPQGSSPEMTSMATTTNNAFAWGTDLSFRFYSVDTSPPVGNFSTFTPGDTVGGDWVHVQGMWTCPDWAQYLGISLVKDSRFDAGSVRISGLSLTAFPRDMNKW